jgi:hypothetical protein
LFQEIKGVSVNNITLGYRKVHIRALSSQTKPIF